MKSKQLKVINPVPDITLFAVNMITRGFQQPGWKKYVGGYLEETYSAYRNNFVDWCLPLPLWRRMGKKYFNKIASSRRFFNLVYDQNKEFGQKLYVKSDLIIKKDLASLTDLQLLNEFEKLRDVFYELNFWGVVPPVIDFENNLLSGWLENKLRSYVKKYPSQRSLQQVFSILTTPEELTYIQKENDDLLKLAAKKKLTDKDQRNHCQKYCWVDYGYLGPVHTAKYYKKRIVNLKKGGSPFKKLATLKKERLQVQKDQRAIAKELHFDKKTIYLFEVARAFMALKVYRKEVMFKGYYAFDLVFKEINKRHGYTVNQLRYCLPDEIVKILKGKKVDKIIVNKRLNSYFLHAYVRGRDSFYYGQKAKQFYDKNLYKEKISKALKQVKGMSAFIGRVRGIVKIVNEASEIKKVKSGDILISIATSPAVLPAMKKAAAFVTDTGGITCHAAIVAREMKKPCIIGTKIATKVFKDGDKVEVDAIKGVVKRI